MPLLDHFHPPLSERRHWHSFHNSWATYVSSQLNALLPAGYFAEANVQFGIEIDAFEEPGPTGAPTVWAPPPPSAFRPVESDGVQVLDIWREPIAVGQRLPTLPLWLRGGLCLPVELEASYERTCVEQRVQPAA